MFISTLNTTDPSGRSLSGVAVANPAGDIDVSASGWSLVQRGPTECGVSEWDREDAKMRRPWPVMAVVPWGEKEEKVKNKNKNTEYDFVMQIN